MRFGQKIFLMSFTLVIIAVNLIGIIMINYTYRINMEKEIDKNILQINNIMGEVEKGIDNLSQIANIYLENNLNIEIYQSAKRVYTNFKEDYPYLQEKLFTEKDKEIKQEKDINEKHIKSNQSMFGIETETDKIVEKINDENVGNIQETETQYETGENIKIYIKDNKLFMKMRKYNVIVVILVDITEVNNIKQEQINYFIELSLASSFIIAFLLSISVSVLTRKIKILNKTVEEVSRGNYDVKIKKIGKDEIGNVAKSFNKMTTSIQENISEIQKVSENRKKFIGNLTHEIRTPLTSIIGYSSLIKNKKIKNNEVILEYCNKIYEEGKYIEKISQKLMDLLLLENGSIEIEETNVSDELNKIVKELENLFPNVIYEKEIKENIYLYVDKTLLKSLVFNLVKNAINSYEENPIVKIELNENKEIKIIDYGNGIPESELEKIKEPFYTLSKDRNRVLSGMGLGLPLCIKIVEIQNGKLKIESKENVGTKITIKLGDKIENKRYI